MRIRIRNPGFSWDCLFAMQKLAHVLFLQFFGLIYIFCYWKGLQILSFWSEKMDVHITGIDFDENTWFRYEKLFSVNIWWGEKYLGNSSRVHVQRKHLALKSMQQISMAAKQQHCSTRIINHKFDVKACFRRATIMYQVSVLTYIVVQFQFYCQSQRKPNLFLVF